MTLENNVKKQQTCIDVEIRLVYTRPIYNIERRKRYRDRGTEKTRNRKQQQKRGKRE